MAPVGKPPRHPVPLVAVAILLIVLWLGLDTTLSQLCHDGFIDRVITSVDQQSRSVPGTTDLRLMRYTGAPLLDRFLACGKIFLDNIVGGSHPELSLYAIYSAGQLIASYTMLVIEGLRVINSHNVFCLTSVWGMLIQTFSYANIMPLYGILHLCITSQSRGQSSTVRLGDPARLLAVIPALIPGFFFVAVLASMPFEGTFLRSLLDSSFRCFPILVAFWQFLAAKAIRRLAVGQYQDCTEAERNTVALGHVYDFTRSIAMLAQTVPLGIIAIARFSPSGLFDSVAEKLTFANVFLPSLLHVEEPWASEAKTMHDFFIYNQLIGSTAAIIWAATLFYLERPASVLKKNVADVIISITREIALGGPAGALIWLLRERDEEVLGAEIAHINLK